MSIRTNRQVGRSFLLILISAMTGMTESACGRDAEMGFEDTQGALIASHNFVQACPRSASRTSRGQSRCYAQIRATVRGNVVPQTAPAGLAAADIRSAYNLPSTGGANQVIGIVDAYDDPQAEADLAIYRAQYGLPACTTLNGCFRKVNQSGEQSAYPIADEGWGEEITLDLDAASAACPNCKILLVEANSAENADLATAENIAVSLGAAVVSNSYGGTEGPTPPGELIAYDHPGVLITVSAGDDGYAVEEPAAYGSVIAVGGTSLVKSSASARGWSESTWYGTGGGCSVYNAKPDWQHDTGTGCTHRTVSDVAAVADPNTGLAIYDSFITGGGGWLLAGGTSLSSPLVAGIFALIHQSGANGAFLYAHPGAFFDIRSGSNGICTPVGLCSAGVGFDAPTGLGSPNGTVLSNSGG